MENRVFPDVNDIGRLKAVTSITIFQGHYRQLRSVVFEIKELESKYVIIYSESS